MEKLYYPFICNDFAYDRCFLCGAQFDKVERSGEHVLPKWLLNGFELYDQRLRLQNNSELQYKNLTIPCCRKCNNNFLSNLEKSFLRLYNNKFRSLTIEDEVVIFQWAAKVLYGLMYKELSLKFDRRDPDLGRILEPAELEEYKMLHLLLQTIRVKGIFNNCKPWSLFVFNYDSDSYDCIANIKDIGLSIKLGRVGFTIVFEDNNVISEYLHLFKHFDDYKLNGVQFLEVSARIFYARSLLSSTQSLMTSYDDAKGQLEIFSVPSLNQRLLSDWLDEEYADYFASYLPKPILERNSPLFLNGQVKTFLTTKNGVLITNQIRAKMKL